MTTKTNLDRVLADLTEDYEAELRSTLLDLISVYHDIEEAFDVIFELVDDYADGTVQYVLDGEDGALSTLAAACASVIETLNHRL